MLHDTRHQQRNILIQPLAQNLNYPSSAEHAREQSLTDVLLPANRGVRVSPVGRQTQSRRRNSSERDSSRARQESNCRTSPWREIYSPPAPKRCARDTRTRTFGGKLATPNIGLGI